MDLSQSANWSLAFENTLSGSSPISVIVPALTSQVLAVYVSTRSQQDTWYTGGWLNQQPQTAQLVDSTTTWNSYSKRLSLGGNIICFPNQFDLYEIEINFPRWFETVFITIWQYVGSQDTSGISTIDTIASSVSEIYTLLST